MVVSLHIEARLRPRLPNDLSVYWQQYPWALGKGLCKVRALVSEMVSYTSVLTIVAFSMERYLAICHPLHHYAMSGLKRAVKIIGVLWTFSLVAATPFAVFTTVNYLDYPPGSGEKVPESGFCAMLSTNIPPSWPIYEMSSLLFFLLPMLVILVLYIRMGIAIRERGTDNSLKRLEGLVHKRRHSNSRKTIIRMLAAVVVAFFLCWAPFHAQRLLYLYANDFPNFPEINEWMYHIAGIFYYISSTVNPILYNVMSAKYRLAFKKTLFGCFMSRKKLPSRNFDSLTRLDRSFVDRSIPRGTKNYDRSSKTTSIVTTGSCVNGGDRSEQPVRTNGNNNNNNNGGVDVKKRRSEVNCENISLLRKSVARDSIKTACGVLVVISPATNKINKNVAVQQLAA
ncbi:hypothetical protein RUM44_008051 [Polyplax serrata]|uniref:G-protein coupled receptors family 1 profile domain-containing protein n=1 Tax=Polyplax serrata TaxID=468196 RepID=A0ABR1B922_POLSC